MPVASGNWAPNPARVHVTGSIKFDAQFPASVSEAAQMVRRTLGDERLIWIAGSTREGEEGMVLDAYQELKNRFPELLLLLVPRHPERFDSVARQCRRAGLGVVRRSADPISVPDTTDVYLGDTMGELALLYAAADVAFVGGSLVPTGGQNILEPCALGIPVVFGPHMFNFQGHQPVGSGRRRRLPGARCQPAGIKAGPVATRCRFALPDRGARVETDRGTPGGTSIVSMNFWPRIQVSEGRHDFNP